MQLMLDIERRYDQRSTAQERVISDDRDRRTDVRNPFEPYRPPPVIEARTKGDGDPTAHETAGVLRMQRLGMSGPRICQVLGISKEQLVHEMKIALDDEGEAHRKGMPIHDAGVKRGTE